MPKPRVTDHARVRYLERVKGVNMAEIDAEIWSDLVARAAEKFSEGTAVVKAEGRKHRVHFTDGVVTTVTKEKKPRKKSRNRS